MQVIHLNTNDHNTKGKCTSKMQLFSEQALSVHFSIFRTASALKPGTFKQTNSTVVDKASVVEQVDTT